MGKSIGGTSFIYCMEVVHISAGTTKYAMDWTLDWSMDWTVGWILD